jgi:hypothetical protein
MADPNFVYMVMWTAYRSQCVEVFNDRSSAVRFANQIGTHARVVCTALRTMSYIDAVYGPTRGLA